jgi:5'(3')-deoxyribonucleotidase
MAKQIVAIDIDDVVANTLDAVRLWANEKAGVSLTEDHYRTDADYWQYYDTIWQRHGIADKIDFSTFLEGAHHDQTHISVVEGAHEAIKALEATYDLIFITSRPIAQLEMTRRWLDQRVDSSVPVYAARNPYANAEARSKGEICAEIGVSYLIDDNVDNCQNAAEYGVEPLLFGSYGWNEHAPHSLRRFLSWHDVKEYLLHEAGKSK